MSFQGEKLKVKFKHAVADVVDCAGQESDHHSAQSQGGSQRIEANAVSASIAKGSKSKRQPDNYSNSDTSPSSTKAEPGSPPPEPEQEGANEEHSGWRSGSVEDDLSGIGSKAESDLEKFHRRKR